MKLKPGRCPYCWFPIDGRLAATRAKRFLDHVLVCPKLPDHMAGRREFYAFFVTGVRGSRDHRPEASPG